MDEEIIEALIKRAKGYSYNEVQEEYSVKEDGEIALTKRKVLEKYCPPDSTALKTYMDICGERSVESYTDEELEEEKSRLLKQLYLEEKEAMSEKKKTSTTKTSATKTAPTKKTATKSATTKTTTAKKTATKKDTSTTKKKERLSKTVKDTSTQERK